MAKPIHIDDFIDSAADRLNEHQRLDLFGVAAPLQVYQPAQDGVQNIFELTLFHDEHAGLKRYDLKKLGYEEFGVKMARLFDRAAKSDGIVIDVACGIHGARQMVVKRKPFKDGFGL